MNTEQLARYRDAVADDRTGAELEQMIAEVEKKDITVHQARRARVRPAPALPADHPRITLLRYKGLTAWRHDKAPGWKVHKDQGPCRYRLQTVPRPLASWLRSNVRL